MLTMIAGGEDDGSDEIEHGASPYV